MTEQIELKEELFQIRNFLEAVIVKTSPISALNFYKFMGSKFFNLKDDESDKRVLSDDIKFNVEFIKKAIPFFKRNFKSRIDDKCFYYLVNIPWNLIEIKKDDKELMENIVELREMLFEEL